MTIGIIGSGAIGTAFARTLARAGIRGDHLQQPRPGFAERTGPRTWPIDQGRHARGSRARRHRLRRRQLDEAARGAGGPAGLGRTHRHRRQQSDRGAAVQAGRSQGPRIERGRRRSRARSARRQGVQSSPRRSAGRRSASRTAAGACCSIPATTAPRRRRWRRSSTASASSASISDRSRSAASSRNFPAGHCRTRTWSRLRSPDGARDQRRWAREKTMKKFLLIAVGLMLCLPVHGQEREKCRHERCHHLV